MKFILDNWTLLLVALSSGAMLAWPLLRGGGAGALTATAAVQLINRERGVVIDVGEPAEFAESHVRGAKNVPLATLEQRLPQVVKNKAVPVILVCRKGGRAQRAVAVAKKLGYQQAQALGGGLKSWKDANLPMDKA